MKTKAASKPKGTETHHILMQSAIKPSYVYNADNFVNEKKTQTFSELFICILMFIFIVYIFISYWNRQSK